jgi:hypothetical protein
MPSVRVVVSLSVGIVYCSLAVNLDRALALMNSEFAVALTAGASPWHYLREALFGSLLGTLAWGMWRQKRHSGNVSVSPWTLLFVLGMLAAAVRTLLSGYGPEYLLYGARPVAFVLVVGALRCYPWEAATTILRQIAAACVPLLLAEVVLAVHQLASSPPFFGATAFGTRPWGTFSAPNNLAVALLGLLLLFVVTRIRWWWAWSAICMVSISVTGTRTALVGMFILFAPLVTHRLRNGLMLIPAGLLLGPLLLYIVSSEEVSGRQIEGENRFGNWAEILGDLSYVELLVGRALGVGTNAAFLADRERFDVPVSDSQLIAQITSLGLVGLVAMLLAAVRLWRISSATGRAYVFPMLTLNALVFNVAEYYPLNLLLALAAGVSAAQRSVEVGKMDSSHGEAGRLRGLPADAAAASRRATGLRG